MRRLTFVLGFAWVMLMLTGMRVLAVNSIEVDEKGNMLIDGNLGPAGVVAVEPISGLQALRYPLPFPGIVGDIVMISDGEPSSTSRNSDLIRFPGNGNMYFFSLIDDPGPLDLADVPA